MNSKAVSVKFLLDRCSRQRAEHGRLLCAFIGTGCHILAQPEGAATRAIRLKSARCGPSDTWSGTRGASPVRVRSLQP